MNYKEVTKENHIQDYILVLNSIKKYLKNRDDIFLASRVLQEERYNIICDIDYVLNR
jgi:hypothetical protein